MTVTQTNSAYSAYKRLYKRMIKEFTPIFEKELRKQVKIFTDDYQKYGIVNLNVIPASLIKKSLVSLHITAGINGAKLAEKEIYAQLPSKGYDPRDYTKADEDDISTWSYVIDQYLETHGLQNLAIKITNTLRNNILRVLKHGNELGWGVDKMVRALDTNRFPKWMAMRIVRTETNKAANVGAMIAATDTANKTGITFNKKWISTQDDRTRRIPRNQTDHLHMDGVVVGMNERFIVPGTKTVDAMLYPGDPDASEANVCNCRCRAVYIPKRNENGEVLITDKPNTNPFTSLLNQGRALGRGIRDFIRNLFKSKN